MNIPITSKSAYSDNYRLARASINTMLMPDLPLNESANSDSSYILKTNEAFYKKRLKSPTSTTIAYKEALEDMINPSDKRQIELYNSNLDKLKSNKRIENLIIEYNSKIDKAYPKTKDLREILINENRFAIGKTKPKLNQWQKLKFVLKYMY